ncbi:MAG: DUF4136 domain-containing protein [Myxococcota bacterium]
MRSLRLLPLLLACVAACAGVSVNQDYDPSADFASYRSFDWFPGSRELAGGGQLEDPFLERRIRTAVGRELAAKGYVRAGGARPDFYVNYHVSVQQKLTSSGMNVGYGVGSYGSWGGVGIGMRTNPVRQYEEGTLVIDFIDGASRKLVWRGTGSKALARSPTPEQTTATIDTATREILKQFPPQRAQ